MAGKITITFAEEGNVPVSLELPISVSEILDQAVTNINLETTEQLSGKADLFMKMTRNLWLKPIIQKYANILDFAGDVVKQDLLTKQQEYETTKRNAELAAIQNIIKIV